MRGPLRFTLDGNAVREPLPYEAAFLAYRKRGGGRRAPLPTSTSAPTLQSQVARSSPGTRADTAPISRPSG
jgi:hypothetical protein